jgi:hypothetical protein
MASSILVVRRKGNTTNQERPGAVPTNSRLAGVLSRSPGALGDRLLRSRPAPACLPWFPCCRAMKDWKRSGPRARLFLFTPFIKLSVEGGVPNARLIPVHRTRRRMSRGSKVRRAHVPNWGQKQRSRSPRKSSQLHLSDPNQFVPQSSSGRAKSGCEQSQQRQPLIR